MVFCYVFFTFLFVSFPIETIIYLPFSIYDIKKAAADILIQAAVGH